MRLLDFAIHLDAVLHFFAFIAFQVPLLGQAIVCRRRCRIVIVLDLNVELVLMLRQVG